jgi:hypothetical protein
MKSASFRTSATARPTQPLHTPTHAALEGTLSEAPLARLPPSKVAARLPELLAEVKNLPEARVAGAHLFSSVAIGPCIKQVPVHPPQNAR